MRKQNTEIGVEYAVYQSTWRPHGASWLEPIRLRLASYDNGYTFELPGDLPVSDCNAWDQAAPALIIPAGTRIAIASGRDIVATWEGHAATLALIAEKEAEYKAVEQERQARYTPALERLVSHLMPGHYFEGYHSVALTLDGMEWLADLLDGLDSDLQAAPDVANDPGWREARA